MSADASATADSRRERTARAVDGLVAALAEGDSLLKGIPSPTAQEASALARQLAGYGAVTYGLWTARGILVLLEEGFSQQCLPLARVLWELRVTLLYIEQDWKVRARRFLTHDVVIRHEYLKKAELARGEPWAQAFLEDQGRAEALRSEYRKVIEKDPDLRHRHWAGKDITIRKMAEEVGMEEEYRFLYAWLSERVHGSVRAIGEAFSHREDGGVDVRPPDYALEVAATTAAGLCQLLLCLSEIFALGEQPAVRKVLRDL